MATEPGNPPPPEEDLAPGRRPGSVTAGIRRLADVVARASEPRSDGSLRRRALYPLYALRVLAQVVRQWARDRCPQQAASLAYQSSLSIVPLIAIGLALLRAIGAAQAEAALVGILSRQVIPVSRKEIADHLLERSRNLSQTPG